MTEISGNPDRETSVEPAASPSAFGGNAWHLAVIAIAGLAFYAFSLFVPFHGEDQRLFLDTPALQSPLTALQALDRMPYAPLTLFGYALNACANPGDPLPLHAVNIMLHIINAMLIYALLIQLMGSSRSKWALGTALVFLVMVPGLYSVYYLAGRPGMQATCFALFALIAFVSAQHPPQSPFKGGLQDPCATGPEPPFQGGLQDPHATSANSPFEGGSRGMLPLSLGASEGETLDYRRLLYAAIAYALAVGSHAAALGLPLAMLALDAARGGWNRVLQHRNMHAAFIGLMLLLERIGSSASGASLDWGGIPAYAWNAVFSLTPLPTAGLIDSAQQAYFPLAGVALALSLALSSIPNRAARLLPAGGLMGFIVVSGFFHWQMQPWNDPVAFWNEAAQRKTAVARECYQNAARYALEYGRRAEDPAERKDLLTKAETAWNGVIANAPAQGDADAATGLGETLQALGRGDEALAAFQRALYADPFHAEASLNAGLLECARMRAGAGEAAGRSALEHFRRLERLGPLPNEAWAPYVLVLANAGEFALALEKARNIPPGAPPLPEAAMKEIEKVAGQVAALQKQEDQYLKTPDQWKEASLVRAQRFAIEGRLVNASYLLEQLQVKDPDPREDALLVRVKEQMAKRAAPAAR